MVIFILFFTSPFNLFVFQLKVTNDIWFSLSLSLSLCFSIGKLSFFKIWWRFYGNKYALLFSLCYIWFDIFVNFIYLFI